MKKENSNCEKGCSINRRKFLRNSVITGAGIVLGSPSVLRSGLFDETVKNQYGMGVDISNCIGCGQCGYACKKENKVPEEPYYFRTWVEMYVYKVDGSIQITSINGGIDNFPKNNSEQEIMKSFFVPKLCNQCTNPPCVQVCPVGATFKTDEGVILVDQEYCFGCRY